MPKVGNNNEPLLERALFGFDGSLWKPLLLDSNGYLEVTLPLAETITARNYGLISGSWQAQPINLGYSDRVTEAVVNASHAGGTISINTTVVPSGEIHTYLAYAWQNGSTSSGQSFLKAVGGGVNMWLKQVNPTTGGTLYFYNQMLVLKPGDSIAVDFYSTTANDSLQLTVWGWKTDIDQ